MKKLLNLKYFWALILFLSGIVAGCSDDDGDEMKGQGTVVIKITDAPFPADLVSEANITVDWVKLLPAFADTDKTDEENGDKKEQSTTVEFEEPQSFNLLELSNGKTELLTELDVSAGIYKEIRLHITESSIVLKDGKEEKLKVPSGDASGLKIKIEPALKLSGNASEEVLLDFDVSRSFVMKGKPENGFIFKPVVRAVANVQSTIGEVNGHVMDEEKNPVENASIYLIQGEDTITSALTSDEGFYALIGVEPGDYTLALNIADYKYKKDVEIKVEAGNSTEQDFVVPVKPQQKIFGKVIDSATNEPIDCATLNLYVEDFLVKSVTSDDKGVFSIENLNSGCYLLTCSVEGYNNLQQQVTVNEGDEVERNMVLVAIEEEPDQD